MSKEDMFFSQLVDENGDSQEQEPQPGKEFARIEEEKINNNETRRRLTPREVKIICIPAAAIVIAVIVALVFYRKAYTYRVSEEAFQPYLMESEIKKDTVLSLDDGGTVVTDSADDGSVMRNVPIYYRNKQCIVLPIDEIYYAPVTGMPGKIDYFTEIDLDDSGNITATKDRKSVSLQGGFIFDGKDFFVFLVPVVLKYNGKSIDLPALSYVEAVYQDDILVYNHETGESIIEPVTTDVIASYGNDYSVSLLADSLTNSDGTKILLFTRADLLDSVFDR